MGPDFSTRGSTLQSLVSPSVSLTFRHVEMNQRSRFSDDVFACWAAYWPLADPESLGFREATSSPAEP